MCASSVNPSFFFFCRVVCYETVEKKKHRKDRQKRQAYSVPPPCDVSCVFRLSPIRFSVQSGQVEYIKVVGTEVFHDLTSCYECFNSSSTSFLKSLDACCKVQFKMTLRNDNGKNRVNFTEAL